jgi:hypothetical protein
MTDESTTDDESGPYCPPLSTSEFAYVAFLGCWEGLGRLENEERDENDTAVWHSPEYYQAAVAAEQMTQAACEIIHVCRYIQAGMRSVDYANLVLSMTI